MNELHEAKTLAEFVEYLKLEHGLSNVTLGEKVGVSSSTIHRMVHGEKADDATLDALAEYAGVTRKWIYNLAKGIDPRPRFSPTVMLLASLLEDAPEELTQDVLTMARALIKSRKSRDQKQVDKD